MEDNVALGIRISVVVVLVASLVAIVLTLLVIGQSILGSGQNKLQSGLTQIEQQDLQQYANVVKPGSVVKSVISLYQGEPLAILIKTTALHKETVTDPAVRDATPISGNGYYFNYGCQLVGADEVITLSDDADHTVLNAGTASTTDPLIRHDGVAHLEGALQMESGLTVFNYDTSGTVATGNPESILDNGLFYSQLIKDITGEIIGIIFTQQK